MEKEKRPLAPGDKVVYRGPNEEHVGKFGYVTTVSEKKISVRFAGEAKSHDDCRHCFRRRVKVTPVSVLRTKIKAFNPRYLSLHERFDHSEHIRWLAVAALQQPSNYFEHTAPTEREALLGLLELLIEKSPI
jgi:hypothetical protein